MPESHRLPHLWIVLVALGLVTGVADAQVYKCRIGTHITYQSAPCPDGSELLPMASPLPPPDERMASEARARAESDRVAAEALRKREDREAAEQRERQAEADELAQSCARLLDLIRQLEAAYANDPTRTDKKASNERKTYIKKCGPL